MQIMQLLSFRNPRLSVSIEMRAWCEKQPPSLCDDPLRRFAVPQGRDRAFLPVPCHQARERQL